MDNDNFGNLERKLQAIGPRALYSALCVTVLLIVAVVSAWFLYHRHMEQIALREADAYIAALSQLEKAENAPDAKAEELKAEQTFEALTRSPSSGVRLYDLARLGNLYAKEGKTDQAVASWNEIVQKTDAKNPLRDFARYAVLNLRTSQDLNAADADKLRTQWTELAQQSNVYRGVAQEGLIAVNLTYGNAQQREEAIKSLRLLASAPDSSLDLKRRANMLLSAVNADSVSKAS